MRKLSIVVLTVILVAIGGAVFFQSFKQAEIKNHLDSFVEDMKKAEIEEVDLMTGYAIGGPLYTKHRLVIVNSSGMFYLPLDTLASDKPLNIVFEASGNLIQNEHFEFRRTLVINATKNITMLNFMAGKFLMSGTEELTKAPDWVSCEVKVTGNNIERIAKSKDGVVVWDDEGIEGIELSPGIYKIETKIYGVPKEELKNVRFEVLLTARYALTKSALYSIRYGFKENIEKIEEDFKSLDNWSVRCENGFFKIVENFKGRSNVLLLLNSNAKYTNEIRIKPPFRLETEIYVPKTNELYGVVGIGGKGDRLDIEVEVEKNKINISLYISTMYLNETNLERCEYGKFCWDEIDKQISEGWHKVVVEADSKGNVTFFVDEKLAGKLKLKLKGLNGYMSIISDRAELGVNHVRISKER
ncbi:hypothetical protein B6U96_10435 [Archaeoglobales archaeon ex4484_92]|nr:MAG: hypothetical protein B6U96_10435 [Archaeoglobales archaeon ex4484_92]